MAPEPPRLAAWLVARVVRRSPNGEAILGDLQEEFARRRVRSPRAADGWYWRQTASLATRYAPFLLARRVRGRLPPVCRRLRETHMRDDVLLALRLLAKNPGFTAAVLVTLALGIGANTAIFSVVDRVLLRPAPVHDLGRVAVVWETDRASGTLREPASVPDFLDVRERSRSFAEMAALLAGQVTLSPNRGEPTRLASLQVTHRLLPMLGIRTLAGRGFTPDEERAGAPDVVLLSESLWERAYGRDPALLGRPIVLNDRPVTVVGIVPQGADYGILQVLSSAAYARGFADRGERATVDAWLPLRPDADSLPRGTHPILVLGRLAAGTTFAYAQRELAGIAADLERTYPENEARGAFVEPLADVVLGPVRPALLVLMAAVLVVLLVACVNVANLLLARGAARARDVAVRRALGARDGRLARQFLTESAVLTLLASALGVGLAYGALHLLLAIAPPDVPRLAEVSVDLRVLAVTLAASAVVAVGFGMVPTLQARRVDVNTALKREAGRASAGRERRRVREALVVAEFALAVVLVVGAGLLIKSFWRLQQVNPGFRSAGVLKAEYQLPASRYPVVMAQWPNFPEVRTFTEELLRRASAEPGVESAALAANHPLDPGFTSSIMVAGRESEAHDWPEISIRRVTPGYFRTVGLGLDQGRLLRDADDVTAAPVVLINRAAARRFFAGRNPLGAAIKLWGADRTVVGVVEDERSHGLAQEAPVALYAPLAQTPSLDGAGVLLLRTRGDPLGLAAAAQRLVHDVDPGLAVFGIEPLPLTVSRSLSRPRFTMLVLGLFAGVALVLAAVGVHGVLSYAVLQRSREIGIRVALGAGPLSVVGMIAREGLTLAGAGLGLGLAGALALTRLLRSLLYGTEPTDPATLIAVCAVLAAVALAASSYPALRAARVDPAETLRLDG